MTQFIPTSRAEMQARGWEQLDVLFISGDAYIDHPSFGTPLLARRLEAEGYRVGILAQPDWKDLQAFQVMGRPRLFAAISAGAMDSMVNHYTAAKKIRRDDAYTPGNTAGKRPNRAVIAYTAAVKGAFKGLPTVIGGIEASLRRLAHYDYWDDRVRRSVLVDSKADLLLFGMAESALLELTRRVAGGEPLGELNALRGTAVLSKAPPTDAIELPSFEQVSNDPEAYNRMFRLSSEQQNPWCGKPLVQKHGKRQLLVNPPALPLTEAEIDRIYALPFCRLPHFSHTERIPAFEQIRHSVTSHRGCFGGCAFCAITHHQGKTIQSRSQKSILREIEQMAATQGYSGTLSDVGGPTANMYGLGCANPGAEKTCRRGSCLYPSPCKNLHKINTDAVRLFAEIRKVPQVKHMFVASGIRYDLLPYQQQYFDDLLKYHVGGRLKVAPESTSERVTAVMRKPGVRIFTDFLQQFRQRSQQLGRRQAIVPYLISGHPGCDLDAMIDVALYLKRQRLRVEQVQDFTPTPGSLATCIYYTGKDPFTDAPLHIPNHREKRLQKALLLYHKAESKADILEALRLCRRESLANELLERDTIRKSADQRTNAPSRRPGRRNKK